MVEDDAFDMFAQSRQFDAGKQSVAASYAYQAEAANTGSSMVQAPLYEVRITTSRLLLSTD